MIDALAPADAGLALSARSHASRTLAPSTRKGYGTDFRIFSEWCQTKGAAALPALPETVAAFIAAQAGSGTRPRTLRVLNSSRPANLLLTPRLFPSWRYFQELGCLARVPKRIFPSGPIAVSRQATVVTITKCGDKLNL